MLGGTDWKKVDLRNGSERSIVVEMWKKRVRFKVQTVKDHQTSWAESGIWARPWKCVRGCPRVSVSKACFITP